MVISCPDIFSLGSHNSCVLPLVTTPPRRKIYPQNLSIQYLVVWGSEKQQKRLWDYSNSQKEKLF